MHVHFIPIEISVVTLTISIIHPQRRLLGQDLYSVRHQTCFVKSRLAVKEYIIPCLNMPVNNLVLVIVPQISCMRYSLLFSQAIEPSNFAVFFYVICSWVFFSVDDVRLKLLKVILVDVFAEG
jgi:hypothetical protein